jgi:hypothetical protein
MINNLTKSIDFGGKTNKHLINYNTLLTINLIVGVTNNCTTKYFPSTNKAYE